MVSHFDEKVGYRAWLLTCGACTHNILEKNGVASNRADFFIDVSLFGELHVEIKQDTLE
jgi:hypothetical protein